MSKNSLIFLLCFWCFPSIASVDNFTLSPAIEQAYQKALSLRFSEAEYDLYRIKQEDPNNLMVHFVENYIDIIKVFLNENKAEFKRLQKNKDYRLNAIRQGNDNSPYYLFTQAEIKLQWALVRIKFEEYFTALTEVRSAYKMLEKNQRLFPEFVPNKRSLGVLHALVGTIPDNYKWGLKLLSGMDGTIEQGKQEIEEVLQYARQNEFVFEEETLVMYALLLLHLKNESEEAWSLIKSSKLNPKQSPLACFALANVAIRTGHNDEAIEILSQRPTGRQYHPYHYLDFLLGLAKLYRQDDDANLYLKAYIQNFKGQNYIKEAYQKLAWYHLLKDNVVQYKSNMALALTRGNAFIGADKTAMKEANYGIVPDQNLVKARLLFDGGYYAKAYQLLANRSAIEYQHKIHRLEFTYRLGRITHKLQKSKEALDHYQATIEKGRDEPWFFACNAALQSGIIYEKKGDAVKAKEFYKLCLSIKPEEYKSGLHQKAKAGLNRLRK